MTRLYSNSLRFVFALVALFILQSGIAQTSCTVVLNQGPITRTTGLAEEQIASGIMQGVAQQYNGMTASIKGVRFWGRVNPASGVASNQVRVRLYNVNQEKPNQILAETIYTLDSSSTPLIVDAFFTTPVSVNFNYILSVEPFTPSSDNYFIQKNNDGDGQNLRLSKLKQAGLWYIGADEGYNLDYYIFPLGTSSVTSNFNSSSTGLTTNFTNTSTGASTYMWDFGDGNTSTTSSPSHTYTSSGTYSVKLKAFHADASCVDSVTKSVTVAAITVVPDYSFSANEGVVAFTNTSTGATSYAWTFDDGNTSTATNPSHTYATSGSYNVKLKAMNGAVADSITKVVSVTVPDVIPSFTSSANLGTITFTNTTTGASTYKWDFDDGNFSTQMNPVHTYTSQGFYDVKLVATSAGGTVKDSVTNTINVMLTGITENAENSNGLVLLGNPVKNVLKLSVKSDSEIGIYNVLGDLIIKKKIYKSTIEEISVSNLNPGIYFIRPETGGAIKFTKINN